MDKRIDNIETSLSKLTDSVHSIDKTLARQEENLKEHMKRTELAEESIKLLRRELKPVQSHVAAVNGILKFIGVLATVLGIVAYIIKITDV